VTGDELGNFMGLGASIWSAVAKEGRGKRACAEEWRVS